MADKNISIGGLTSPLLTSPIPNNCRFVGIHKILCERSDGAEECEIIEGNKILCGVENKECEIYEGVISCQRTAELVDHNPHNKGNTDLFIDHAYLVVIAAILSLTATQIIKPFIWKTCSEKSDAVIRLFAVLTGAVIAYSLSNPFEMIDVYMGASAGAVNAFVIKMFKAKVKKTLGVETTEPQVKKDEDDG